MRPWRLKLEFFRERYLVIIYPPFTVRTEQRKKVPADGQTQVSLLLSGVGVLKRNNAIKLSSRWVWVNIMYKPIYINLQCRFYIHLHIVFFVFRQPAKTQVNLDPAISGMTSTIPMSSTMSSQPLSYLRMSCVSNVARSRELPLFHATVSKINKHSQLRIFNSTFLATKGHASQTLTSHQLLWTASVTGLV